MGLLDRFRKRKRGLVRSHTLAMVLLPDSVAPDVDAVFATFRERYPLAPSVLDITSEGLVTTARFPGGVFGIVHIPAPVPETDLAGPVAVAWHWPTAAEEVAAHRSHIIVHAGADLNELELRVLHSNLVAAVVEAVGAIGVYVGEGMLVRRAEDYVNEARDTAPNQPAVMLWIGLNPVSEAEGVSAYTTGLSRFGLVELEVHRSNRPPLELLATLADTAAYQITTRGALKAGHTFGVSEFDRAKVSSARSAFLPDESVLLLEL